MKAFSWMTLAELLILSDAQYLNNGPLASAGIHGVRYDTGSFGPETEEIHYFTSQWPTGIAMTEHNKTLVCYPRINNEYPFTLGYAVNTTAETAYPSLDYNTPEGGLYTVRNGIAYGSNSSIALISVSSIFVTTDGMSPRGERARPSARISVSNECSITYSESDVVWVLDTGRPMVTVDGATQLALASVGGPKLVGILAHNGSIVNTFTFPSDVHYPDSYMHDMRFNLLSNVTDSGKGVAYIADSSPEGRSGFIMVDLGTGESWRQLSQHESTLPTKEAVPSYDGIPFYMGSNSSGVEYFAGGLEGIELSLEGDVLYYSTSTSEYLYSIETSYLLSDPKNDTARVTNANQAVRNLGQKGGKSSGFACDSNGMIYMLMPESNAVYTYNTTLGLVTPYVRDPRLVYPHRAFAGYDGYMYVVADQWPYQPAFNDGLEQRQFPAVLLRSLMPNNASRSLVLGPGDPTGHSYTNVS